MNILFINFTQDNFFSLFSSHELPIDSKDSNIVFNSILLLFISSGLLSAVVYSSPLQNTTSLILSTPSLKIGSSITPTMSISTISISPTPASSVTLSTSISQSNTTSNSTAPPPPKKTDYAALASLYVAVAFIPGMLLLAIACRFVPDFAYKYFSNS